MKSKPLLVYLLIITMVLTGCASPAGAEGSSTVVLDASATRTLSLPSSPTPDTPSPTKTATRMPTSTPTPSFMVTLEAVGDIMLGRTVGEQVLAKGPEIVFAGVQSVLDSADVRVGNLECAITERDTPEDKMITLKAPPETAKALSLGKFDVVSLANNHAMDYGYEGLSDTQSTLGQYNIATVGAGANFGQAHSPVILERNGLRLAFLAYVDVPPENSFDARTWIATETKPGIAWASPDQIKADVTAAKLQADVVIVLLHSGYEVNSSVTMGQKQEAHAAVDAGAALVIGSHPHILQGIEQYHGGLIAYSLGNFVFDNYLGIANATVILRVVLARDGVQSYDYVPVLIENGLPVITSIDNARGIETLVAPVNP